MNDDARAPRGRDVELVTWQLAVDAAGVGAFDWDLATRELVWDDRLLAVFGVTREEFVGPSSPSTPCSTPTTCRW